MNTVICGAGEVGRHAAEVLGVEGHNITIIDRSAKKLATLEDIMDVRTLRGNATQAEVLVEAGCDKADLCIAATDSDETNLLSAAIATGVGADRTIARVHHSAYFEGRGLNYCTHLGIDHLVCPDYATAADIAQSLRNPGALAIERFARGRVEMQQISVSDDAPAVGCALHQLSMPDSARIVAIEREQSAMIPDGMTVIRRGDIVTLIGDVNSFDKARRLFHAQAARHKKIMVMGGSPVGVWLCRALRGKAFSVRLFEPNPPRAEELAAKLDWVTVLRVDPLDTDTLTLERIDQADAFVALTHDDENNILAAARAKSMGAKEAIAVLQRGTYLHLLEHVGIDRAFSPRVAAVSEVQRLVNEGPIQHLATLAVGIADVFEIRVPPAAKEIIGKPLKQVKLPPKTILAAIQRGDDVSVPGAEDWVDAGDVVVAVTPTGQEKELKRLLAVK